MTSVRPKLAPNTPKLVTAWDVRSGRTVYRTSAGRWSENIRAAVVLSGHDAETALGAAKSDEGTVLDPYLMEVSEDGKIAGRETLRETIRSLGPTTHPEFRKPVWEKDNAEATDTAADFVWGYHFG